MNTSRSIAELPGPRGLPLIGSLHQIGIRNSHIVLERWSDRYGPMYRFHVAGRHMVVVSDSEEINAVLRERPDSYRRWREVERAFQEFGFPGVFSVEGTTWRPQRRLVVGALNAANLHRQFHIVRTATERLHRRLLEAACTGQALDITRELTSFSVDVTSALVFGHDLNTLERRSNELQDHIESAFNMLARRTIFPIPYWRWVQLPADRRLNRSLAEIRRAVIEFIAEARARIAARAELLQEPENFIEAMLVAQHTEQRFSDEEIIGNVFTLLLAGEDTTAHTMAWTIWFLAQHPEIQDRWAAEARDTLARDLFPPDHETVAALPYGEAVLREAMRLKSVAAFIAIVPLIDTTICDTRIPAGTRLVLLTRRVNRAAGGDDFDPARWVDDDGARAPTQRDFLSFGAGPRFCPGRNLAFLEAGSAMAMIARNFEIALDTSRGPVEETLNFTVVPSNLRVRLRERQQRAEHALASRE